MVNMIYNLSMILLNTFFIVLILVAVTKRRPKTKRCLLFLGICTIINGASYLLLSNTMPIYSVIGILVSILAARFILKVSCFESSLSVGIFYILAAVAEIIFTYFFISGLGYSAKTLRNTVGLSFMAQIAIYSFVILFLIAYKLIYRKECTIQEFKRQNLLIIGLLLVVFGINILLIGLSVRDNLIVPINIMFMVIFVIIMIVYIMVMQRLIANKEENEELKRYIQTIQELSEELRRFKHNYLNMLYGFSGYIEHKEWDKLEEYYEEIVQESSKLNNNAFSIQKVQNNALFGLLSTKLRKAKELGLIVNLNIIDNVDDLGIKNSDLCELLGIYIDNAMEAAIESEAKLVVIEIRKEKNSCEILVSNTFKGEIKISEIGNRRFTTKGGKRGEGLYLANQILGKYTNVLFNTYVEKDIFFQELIIEKGS